MEVPITAYEIRIILLAISVAMQIVALVIMGMSIELKNLPKVIKFAPLVLIEISVGLTFLYLLIVGKW